MFQLTCPFLITDGGLDTQPSHEHSPNRLLFIGNNDAETKDDDHYDNLPLLVIGGSDGSGTRAVVDPLQQHLGVIAVSDDARTFDVEATELMQGQGWPGVVNMVLNETHSARYDYDDLSSSARNTIRPDLEKYWKILQMRQRYKWKVYSRHYANSTNRIPRPESVSFAMKAPVTMLLLPVLTNIFGRIKFLHVVRE